MGTGQAAADLNARIRVAMNISTAVPANMASQMSSLSSGLAGLTSLRSPCTIAGHKHYLLLPVNVPAPPTQD